MEQRVKHSFLPRDFSFALVYFSGCVFKAMHNTAIAVEIGE